MNRYNIVRVKLGGAILSVVREDVSFEEADAHCSSPENLQRTAHEETFDAYVPVHKGSEYYFPYVNGTLHDSGRKHPPPYCA